MDLWIRSQDKSKLLKISKVEINYFSEDNLEEYDIKNYSDTLGTYKSKKRTLEVLNEIQNFAEKGFHETDVHESMSSMGFGLLSTNQNKKRFVYEMPKE